jgi:hypothetical protein
MLEAAGAEVRSPGRSPEGGRQIGNVPWGFFILGDYPLGSGFSTPMKGRLRYFYM